MKELPYTADWIPCGYEEETWLYVGKCSNCGREVYPYAFCPHCGSKLNVPKDIKHKQEVHNA